MCWIKPAALSLTLGTNDYLKNWTEVIASGPTSDIEGNREKSSILLLHRYRAVIPKFEGIQEESPDGLVKTQLQGSQPSLTVSESRGMVSPNLSTF